MWGEMLEFRIPSNPLSRAHIWAAAGYAIWQGVGIVLGGDIRWTGPTYTIVREAPGGPYAWGAASIALGVMILIGSMLRHWRVKAVGLLGLSGWSLAFSYGFGAAILADPTAGTTGAAAYAYICVSTAILVWVDEAGTGRRHVRA
jgi:hypothetical protein